MDAKKKLAQKLQERSHTTHHTPLALTLTLCVFIRHVTSCLFYHTTHQECLRAPSWEAFATRTASVVATPTAGMDTALIVAAPTRVPNFGTCMYIAYRPTIYNHLNVAIPCTVMFNGKKKLTAFLLSF